MSGLFADLPARLSAERVDALLETRALRLERIVSTGQATPSGEWYDQDRDEWVVVLRGRARLALAAPDETVTLGPGDHVLIAAHRRHRVEWTSPDEPTVWLALHFSAEDDRGGRPASP